MNKPLHIYLPKWAIIVYGALAVILIPWILILAEYLPTRHLARHWDFLWVGFDVIVLVTLIVTVYFMIRQTIWVIMSASALATLFIVDAWFDILTSKPGKEQIESILMGIIEVSLSFLTFRLVFHVIHQSTPEKNINMRLED